MPEPTKADLKAAVTKLTEENAALYDIFAAAREAADAGTDYPWIIGYIGNVGQPCDRGNIQILRVLAAGVRRGPGRTAPVITDSGRTCDQANPGTGAWCHRDGDHGEHRDTNGETWRTDEASRTPGAPLCDSELPLKHGGVLKCTLDNGHYGAHSAIAGECRWLSHGDDARDENGDRIAPASVTA